MQACDQRVYEIVEKAMEGHGLTREEVCELYAVEPYSKEAALIRWAGQELSMQATGGIAEIHAQIGLNATTCPKNCLFCSFARVNDVRTGVYEVPKNDVLEYAKVYVEEGANLLLMLTTASYQFEKLEDMVAAVRAVIPADMPLLVNTEDLTLERAKRLKAAGAQGAYHAVRMGEGVDTSIPVEERMTTFANLREAGLKLSTCVEPVGPEHTPEELTEATFRCIESDPKTSGVGRRISVPNTKLFDRGMLNDVEVAKMVAVYRLATGLDYQLNCSAGTSMAASAGANLAWAEVGTNPRDTVERTEHGGRGDNIVQLKKMFAGVGWTVRDGFSPGWFD